MAPPRVIPYAPVLPVPREPILVAAVDLTNPGTPADPVWQFVYGSLLYQTLFAVYANFTAAAVGAGAFDVQSVRLKLVNYQGVLNIGFTDEADPVYRPDLRKLYFGVRGGSALTEISCSLVAPAGSPLPGPLRVTRGNPNPLTFARMLYPLEPFHFPLGTRRPYDVKAQAGIPNVSVFDTEFQARSGYDYFHQPDRAGMYNHNGHDLDYIRNGGAPLGSPRCHEGVANLTA